MHLSSGILDGPVEAATALLAVGGVAVAARHAITTPDPRCTPARLAAVSAAVFAGQMLNVPVAGGTSGHLLGVAAAVALLGTTGGLLSVSAVLAVQCLVFADGGLSALGANVVNMALIPGLVAAAVLGQSRSVPRVAAAGALSVFAAVVAFSVEFAVGGATGDGAAVTGAMITTHVPMAALEALASVALVAVGTRALASTAAWGGLAALAVLAAPWASAAPDGLERVAIDRGFASFATPNPVLTAAADYELGAGSVGVVLAGLLGVVVVGALTGSTSWLVGRAAIGRGGSAARSVAS